MPHRPMEYKTAALTSPTPARPVGRRAERVTAVLGPIGTEFRGDTIEPGALARAIRERLPRVAVSHDWRRGCGIVTGGVEVGPGDPRLPEFTSDGEPWPADGGGIVLAVDLMPGTTADAALAVKSARAAGQGAAWTFGYRVIDAVRGRRHRRISRLDVFTIAPPSAGEVKRTDVRPGDLEIKGLPVGNSVQHSTRKRFAIQCGSCDQPIALSNRPLRAGAGFICSNCIDDLGRLVDPFDLPEGTQPETGDTDDAADFGTFEDDYPDNRAPRLGAEAAYGQATNDEVEHEMRADGSVTQSQPGRRRWQP